MTCSELREYLSEVVVGGGSPWRRLRVNRHLRGCASCRAEKAALERAGRLVSRLELESAPVELWDSLRRHVEASVRRRAPRPVDRLVLVGALTVVLLVVGVMFRRPPTVVAPPIVVHTGVVDQDMRAAVDGHVSADYAAPLSDPAAAGLRLESEEEES